MLQDVEVKSEARRRRTFAVISHPDAGKSTLTEALLLHARIIAEAGATHGKAGRRATVSDWMDMEKDRGISISSSALQFHHRDVVLNLVDTPGHADFSEDTYRVLTAVDSAIMLLDAAKGMEAQTMKLFEVCRARRIPIITVINKWDRPGLEPLELLDEIESRTGLRPTPLTWPVGIAGHFHGVVDCASGDFVRFTRTPGGSTLAATDRLSAEEASAEVGDDWTNALEEVSLLESDGYVHDQRSFEDQETTPVLFTAAALNFGVGHLLDTVVDIAPSAGPRLDAAGQPRPVESDFSAHVFKVQAGMDRSHRDRLAFARVCSGVFHRGDVVTHEATGRSFATKYAHSVFGRDRETVEIAYPGDIIGLVNAGGLRAGDTLYSGTPVRFPRIPPFAPEHFRVVRPVDIGRHKQFQRGMTQLNQEGVVQVLYSELRGQQAPVMGAVGPMQFEVAVHRMEHEFNAPVHTEQLPYTLAMQTREEDAQRVDQRIGAEVVRRDDGALLALLTDKWQVRGLRHHHPDIVLEPIVAQSPDV
ncbi:peptide chain release factor 3 [Tessaracoccus flavus]|uniref:peptide chain release factor 3 n=1 Tax=Tessaracoccus flavus TaxID=1610493 RepID=UPI001D054AB0|nr:peptide chain release factor 3 [Tessaracoccus flavus]